MTEKNENGVAGAPGWLLPDRAYDVLKWVGLIVCPALATFMLTLGQVWGIPCASEIAATTVAAGALIGALIGVSAVKGGGGANGSD